MIALLRLRMAAAAGVCQRDFALFRTYRMRLLTTMCTTAFSLTMFYYISRLVDSRAVGTPSRYYAYVVVGIVILGVLTGTLVTPVMTLRQELLTGTFERMVLSPFGPVLSILSLTLFPLLLALVLGLFTIAFAGVAFGLSLHWATAALAIPVALLGAVAFAPFGLVVAIGVILFKQTRSGTTFIVTAITVVSGIYFPTVLLPDWIRWLADIQPFTPGVDLLRHVLIATPLRESVATTMLKLIVFPAVMLPVSLWSLRRAIESARRNGTVIEY